MKKFAVLLCGSGFKDGSEIRESVGVLWALSAHKAHAQCFALNEAQKDVINCLTNEPMNTERNQLVEAARIARGQIENLENLNPDNFDGLIIPGGFGAAKNLCNFATQGGKGEVHPLVKKIIRRFVELDKPIGAVCIAPVIVGMSIQDIKLELTLGEECDAALEMKKLGHMHILCKANEAHVDRWHKIVSTPAYMDDEANLAQIFCGISDLVKECIALVK